MSEVDRDLCRKAAAECVQLARATTDPERKQILLTRSQEWLKLAYSAHEARFERLVTDFNSEQMDLRKKGGAPISRTPKQRQEVQQQQSKIKPDDET
jgi:hypothetical protein